MPRLRESPQQVFYSGLTKKIKTQMIQQGYDRKSLANRACVNYVTLCKRLREPDTWILSELLAVMQVLKMDFGELYEKGA